MPRGASDVNCVVGHPRSGTTLVARLLNAAGTENCRHEYLCDLSSMAVSMPTTYYAGSASASDVLLLLRHYDDSSTPWVRIDSNWKLTWILPVLLERYPDARILHLTRDPRTNIPSCHNLDFYGNLHMTPRFSQRQFWLSCMPDIHHPDWEDLPPFERNCAFWAETHRLALDALARHPHTHRLRLEDIVDRRARSQVLDFFGVDHPAGWKEALTVARPTNLKVRTKLRLRMYKDDRLPKYERWPSARRGTLRAFCGETADRLGYSI
jgi:hypothetical protein